MTSALEDGNPASNCSASLDAASLPARMDRGIIKGQISVMVAKGMAHSAAITRIERVLSQRLASQVLLQFQAPVRLNDFSEPEPDVAVLQVDPLDYEDHHPTPSEVFLLMEVVDTTLRRDRELKVPTSGQSQVQEYWILDVQERCWYMFREPGATGYSVERVLAEPERIAPLAFPNLGLTHLCCVWGASHPTHNTNTLQVEDLRKSCNCEIQVGEFLRPQS